MRRTDWTGRVVGAALVLLAAAAGVYVGRAGERNDFSRTDVFNRLRQLALALHNYHDQHGCLPPAAIRRSDGTPLLSWRVALLPYVEEEDLYQRFKLDEPWDSPHNRTLLSPMPSVFDLYRPGTEHRTTTLWQVIVGPGMPFESSAKLNFRKDFPDGLSNTILIAEATEPVPWTAPQDLQYDPAGHLPKIGGLSNHVFFVALCDGSCRGVTRQVSEQTLRAAITRNGGEELGKDW